MLGAAIRSPPVWDLFRGISEHRWRRSENTARKQVRGALLCVFPRVARGDRAIKALAVDWLWLWNLDGLLLCQYRKLVARKSNSFTNCSSPWLETLANHWPLVFLVSSSRKDTWQHLCYVLYWVVVKLPSEMTASIWMFGNKPHLWQQWKSTENKSASFGW